MAIHLDRRSRTAAYRLLIKIGASLLLALPAKTNYILAVSTWLSLYALFTALLAVLFRDGFAPKSFTHWDEALWLTAVALALRLILNASA